MYVVYLSINVSLTSAFLNRQKKIHKPQWKMLKRELSDFETCNYIPASDMDPDSVASFNFLNFIYLIIFKRIANGVTCHCCFSAFWADPKGGGDTVLWREDNFVFGQIWKFRFMYTCGIDQSFKVFCAKFDVWKSRFGAQSFQKRDLKKKMRKCPKTANFGHVLVYSSN